MTTETFTTLRKMLQVEGRKGYTDTAVVGGLDAYLTRNIPQATADQQGFPSPQPSYRALDPDARRAWAALVVAWLDAQDQRGGTGSAPFPSPQPSPRGRGRQRGASRSAPAEEISPDAPDHASIRDGTGEDRIGEHPDSPLGARGGSPSPGPFLPSQGGRGDSTGSVPPPAKPGRGQQKRSDGGGGPHQPSSPVARKGQGPGGQPDIHPESPVRYLPGVGKEYAEKLARLGAETVRHLLYLFPRRHVDYSLRVPVADLRPGLEQTVIGVLWEATERRLGTRSGTEALIGDDTGNVRAVWFNQPHVARTLGPRAQAAIALSGRVTVFHNQLVFESPEYEVLDRDDEDRIHTGRLVPIYPGTEGISPRTIRRIVKTALDRAADHLSDPLPPDLRRRLRLLSLPDALRTYHYPDSPQAQEAARGRLAFDELLLIQLGVASQRQTRQQEHAPALTIDQACLDAFLGGLPFPLTGAQRRALDEIVADLQQPRPMSRLLQGDVGSGKTIVAAAALVLALRDGMQGAIMAPTEILAEQHYRNLCALLEREGGQAWDGGYLPPYLGALDRSIKVALLVGSLTPKQKEDVRARIAAGQVDLVVGTHALIQDGVAFARLGVAVIDEQHRFGVAQRWTLRQKGGSPHVLVMTATPIPRTLALTMYGDLDVSILNEMPPGRQPIITRWLRPAQRREAYRFVREQLQQGRQAFIVCPLIEESEVVEARAATAEYERLSTEVFPDLRLGLLHGRMSAQEKDRVMRAFRDGETDLLVSTAVVEVGIDVPNATVMLIEGADRFGLSQLHQFRGRVGRGAHQSYCLLLADDPSQDAQERLAIVQRTQDGFVLAEEDLRLRGPGEFFGTRQTGLPAFQLARLTDVELLEMARREAQALLADDPTLSKPEHEELARARERAWRPGAGELS